MFIATDGGDRATVAARLAEFVLRREVRVRVRVRACACACAYARACARVRVIVFIDGHLNVCVALWILP